MEELSAAFKQIGLSAEKAKETAQNKKLAPNLLLVIQSVLLFPFNPKAGGPGGIEKGTGSLLYILASTITKNAQPHLPAVSIAIKDGRLKTSDQVQAAIKFCESAGDQINASAFNKACGVGVIVSQEDIVTHVTSVLDSKADELQEKRYTLVGQLFGLLRNPLRWADSLAVKEEFDRQILALLGPKDERDDTKAKKKKEKADSAPLSREASQEIVPQISMAERAKSTKFVFEGELSKLHKAGGNPQINDSLIKEHLARTGGKVVTRFPPEPNGFLHIGHAKAININFGYANAYDGITNLRFDDTNPEAEEELYFNSILETVRWLGYEPSAITYSSDNFQHLFEMAVELIKKDKAFICYCTGEEMHEMRGGDAKGPRRDCPHRNTSIEASLKEFYRMKNGEYKEGEVILRMKMDMQHPNPQFWDLVAYRVLNTPHIRTKTEWCIYPTYDYTHCLCDSFEDITHSLCTTEFTLSRESYYWLVDALEIYKPVQWEYGKLKLSNTVLSKRKLNKLVTGKYVSGWDDPRLHTLMALRRRGFTPEAINAFVRELGVTTSNATIPMNRLENYVRDHLNETAPRLMAVLDPLRITLTNLPYGHVEEIILPNRPKDDAMGFRTVPFAKVVYIDASDFRIEDDPDFRRLAPGKTVGLLHVPYAITCTDFITDSTGKVIEVLAKYEFENQKKAKTYIQWVAESARHQSPISCEIRVYQNLFHHSDPDNKDQVPGGWLSDINPESLIVKKGMVEVGVKAAKLEDKFQFLRVGYFCIDPDTDIEKVRYVFNRTVTLKEDNKKN